MHIKETDTRARKWEYLKDATGENTTSGALDTAADYYLRMAGGTGAHPTGALEDLLELAEQQGSVTPGEIVEVLNDPDRDETPEDLPLEHEQRWSVGHD